MITKYYNLLPKQMACRKQRNGFTLIELLVAISVFVVVVTSASAIYIAIIRSQQKTNLQRLTSQDARYAMETITREVRMATGDVANPAIKVEKITNPDGRIEYKLIITTKNYSDGTVTTKTFYLNSNDDKVYVKVNNAEAQPITSDNIRVTEFKLENYIDATPTGPNYKPERQPSVTITITTQQKEGAQAWQKATTTLRTTISSRDYRYAQ